MIEVDSLSKYYGQRPALDSLTFRIEAGEVIGFLGLNGAGKTTLLKILSGLILPSAGTARVDGLEIWQQPDVFRRRIGFLPDRPPLYADMSVREMLGFAGRINGLKKEQLATRIDEVAELTQLREVLDDQVAWLSHGYRQRLGIAQAVVHKPALVLLDEPINGLDPKQIVSMRSMIRDLGQQHTVLLSSHILGEISQTCDRLMVLNQGRLVATGTEAELAGQFAATRVEALLRAEAKAVQKVAEACEGVSAIELQHVHGELQRLRADVGDEAARERLLAGLVKAGFAVQRYAEAELGLESVFLRLTEAQGADVGTEVTPVAQGNKDDTSNKTKDQDARDAGNDVSASGGAA